MKLKKIAKWLCLLYLCVCVTACTLQREILYHPFFSIGKGGPEANGLPDFGDVRLKDQDGTQIDAWYHEAKQGFPTILFFHGNAGSLISGAWYSRALADAGFGLLAVDYRGYGVSKGSPSEEGLYQDARAAVAYVTHERQVPLSRIVLYGESLGTGVAVQMATEYPLGAIVLQSPYTSMEAMGELRFPWLPVHMLVVDKFDSLSKIARVHVPLLLMHGENDNVVPVQQGKTLFAAANEPKQAVYFADQGHNDLNRAQRVRALVAFLRKQGLVTP